MHNRIRYRALVALAALALVQLFHLLDVLRYAEGAEFPRVLLDPLAVTGIGSATGAWVATACNARIGPKLTIAAGTAVAAGFLIYHGLPVDIGVNNPYWGPDSHGADAVQWLSVLAVIATGATAAHCGRLLDRKDVLAH